MLWFWHFVIIMCHNKVTCHIVKLWDRQWNIRMYNFYNNLVYFLTRTPFDEAREIENISFVDFIIAPFRVNLGFTFSLWLAVQPKTTRYSIFIHHHFSRWLILHTGYHVLYFPKWYALFAIRSSIFDLIFWFVSGFNLKLKCLSIIALSRLNVIIVGPSCTLN